MMSFSPVNPFKANVVEQSPPDASKIGQIGLYKHESKEIYLIIYEYLACLYVRSKHWPGRDPILGD